MSKYQNPALQPPLNSTTSKVPCENFKKKLVGQFSFSHRCYVRIIWVLVGNFFLDLGVSLKFGFCGQFFFRLWSQPKIWALWAISFQTWMLAQSSWCIFIETSNLFFTFLNYFLTFFIFSGTGSVANVRRAERASMKSINQPWLRGATIYSVIYISK